MRFILSSITDPGIRKTVNQDRVYAHSFPAADGEIAFAVVCDGMGGHTQGEVASGSVMMAFANWAANTLPALPVQTIDDKIIREQWSNIIEEQNQNLRGYGVDRGITLGTTVTALLITAQRWYCVSVGDSRAYEITRALKQLTRDHSLVACEVKRGNMTAEQAEQSPKRHILLRCIGIAEQVSPDFFFGIPSPDAVYLLCSDGFRHCITDEELLASFQAGEVRDNETLAERGAAMIELNKQRGETDNISVVTVVTS